MLRAQVVQTLKDHEWAYSEDRNCGLQGIYVDAPFLNQVIYSDGYFFYMSKKLM